VERFEAAVSDPELTSSRQEIALLRARLGELTRQLSTGESGAAWKALGKTYTELREAVASQDGGAIGACITRIGNIIAVGKREYAVWKDICGAIRDKDVASVNEAKRLSTMSQYVTVEQVALLMGMIEKMTLKHVPDPAVRKAIADDLRSLLHRSCDPSVIDTTSTPALPVAVVGAAPAREFQNGCGGLSEAQPFFSVCCSCLRFGRAYGVPSKHGSKRQTEKFNRQ
jgi:deoxycytidylate deaminase